MKRALICVAVGIVLLIIGYVTGRAHQHAKTGYHFAVREQRQYETLMGPVEWKYVTESVGLPFLDPGTTVIEFQGRTIYKARRGFDEDSPFAQNVQVSNGCIEWDDRSFRFRLAIDELRSLAPDETNDSR